MFIKHTDRITIERKNGDRYEDVDASVSEKLIIILKPDIPLEAGDVILRQLPSGIVERFVVIDPGFYAKCPSQNETCNSN